MHFEIDNSAPPERPTRQTRPQAKQLPEHRSPRPSFPWRYARIIARTALYVGLVLFVCGKYLVKENTGAVKIEPNVRQDPHQESISEIPFTFEYRGHSYQIKPVATYDLSGLVVTHNDISSVFDAYHTSDSVDFRDICVVWGANVGSGIYKKFRFWSEPWSCHAHTNDTNAAQSLVETQLSNNHLLSDSEEVRDIIRSVRVGDQIRLQGKLINYWPTGQSELVRQSSLTREDTGNGACEVMWVEQAEILQRGSSYSYQAKTWGFWLLVSAVGLNMVLFVFAPYGR